MVVATRNPEYNNYALNKPELERLLAPSATGTAYGLRRNGSRQRHRAHLLRLMLAEEVSQKIAAFWLRPRAGRYGEFYTLPLGFVPDEGSDTPF